MIARQRTSGRHHEQTGAVRAFPEAVFERADDHAWLDDLPPTPRWRGLLFGGIYARWCVEQIVNGIARQFGRAEGVRT